MKKILIGLLLVILYVPATLILSGVLSLPLFFLQGQEGLGIQALSELLQFLGAVLTAFLFFLIQKRKFREIGLSIKGHLKDLPGGMYLALILYGVGYALSLLFGWIDITGTGTSAQILLLQVLLFLLVALFEETMMRGYILNTLVHSGMNKWIALALSSMLFSIMHFLNPEYSMVSALNIFLAGVLLGYLYLLTRNLWLPISLHFFWNFIQGPILGYQVSGGDFGGGVLHTSAQDPVLWSGGGFGFEGSLLCSILMVVILTLLFCFTKPMEDPAPHPVDAITEESPKAES